MDRQSSGALRHYSGDAPRSARGEGNRHISANERLICLAGSALLLGWAARRRGPPRWGATALGAALAARGGLGRNPLPSLQSRAERQIAEDQGWRTAVLTTRSVTIDRPREEVYEAWRDLEELQNVLENIEKIEVLDQRRSRWRAKGPAQTRVEWDAEIYDEEKGKWLAWRALEGGDVNAMGEVEFRDARDGEACEVRASIAYEPPAGQLGRLVAMLFRREPVVQTVHDLRRFKQYMETGEIAASSRERAVAGGAQT